MTDKKYGTNDKIAMHHDASKVVISFEAISENLIVSRK